MACFIPVQIPALFLNSQEFTRALKVMQIGQLVVRICLSPKHKKLFPDSQQMRSRQQWDISECLRRLQKVHVAFASVLLCDAQVQAAPQKLLPLMAMVLHGPKTPPNTHLPVHLFLEFLWETQSRSWKKILLFQFFTSGWVSTTAPCAHSWPGCLLLCGSSSMNFPPILLAFGMFPVQKRTVSQGLGFLHHTPKGQWCSGAVNHHYKKSFATLSLYKGIWNVC